MSDEAFEALVDAALKSIPMEFHDALSDIAIVIAEEPDEEQRKSVHLGLHMNLFGLFQGVPRTQKAGGLQTFPDKITIFKNPILRSRSTQEAIVEQIRSTVLHEIGHFLGMSDEELRKLRY